MADLKELFKQAAEIAQQVPENMQEAAFNRALDLLTNESDEERTARRVTRAKRSQNRKANPHRIEGSSADSTSVTKSSSPRKSSSGLGPKSAIAWLMQSGFFGTGKTRAEVQEYLRKKRGYNIGTDQLGVAMLRLVREGVLERAENEDGQYEFKQPSSQ
ncbi:MAG: hypothetical protein QOG23_2887 [Blastocatellia bacterium]|jgi:hypothetical protein|nr:hypothetical protein [Blastocatellia bacterium]